MTATVRCRWRGGRGGEDRHGSTAVDLILREGDGSVARVTSSMYRWCRLCLGRDGLHRRRHGHCRSGCHLVGGLLLLLFGAERLELCNEEAYQHRSLSHSQEAGSGCGWALTFLLADWRRSWRSRTSTRAAGMAGLPRWARAGVSGCRLLSNQVVNVP